MKLACSFNASVLLVEVLRINKEIEEKLANLCSSTIVFAGRDREVRGNRITTSMKDLAGARQTMLLMVPKSSGQLDGVNGSDLG